MVPLTMMRCQKSHSRDLVDMSDRIVQNMEQMAPKPQFANEAERNLAAALGQDIPQDDHSDIDPDAMEIESAAHRDEVDAQVSAHTMAAVPQNEVAQANGSILSAQAEAEAAAQLGQALAPNQQVVDGVAVETIPPGQMKQ